MPEIKNYDDEVFDKIMRVYDEGKANHRKLSEYGEEGFERTCHASYLLLRSTYEAIKDNVDHFDLTLKFEKIMKNI